MKKKKIEDDFEVLIGSLKPLTKEQEEEHKESFVKFRILQKERWAKMTEEERQHMINTSQRLQKKYKLEDEINKWLQKL